MKALQYVAIESEKSPLFQCVYCYGLRQISIYSFIAHQTNFEKVSQEEQTFEALTCSSEEGMLLFQPA